MESISNIAEAQETIKAICEFEHSEGDVKGLVYLKQKSGGSLKFTDNLQD